ncbi:PPOX class F420-dependent oxidoreductase [Nocardia sp. NPDC004068]|uniref:PPOX class F420-dependent oxidoreductase n=1 Tax=Nocardia sp. NPDC004068 TaxID=3364303 RepID=UPI0036B6DBBC
MPEITPTQIPNTHQDLLTRPLFAHLSTLREDGSPQTNPMWFAWDGTHLRFTTTRTRRKFRNVEADPRVSLSINDPDQPYRYLEVRGEVTAVESDPTGEFFLFLARRYEMPITEAPADAPDRVVLVVTPTGTSVQ